MPTAFVHYSGRAQLTDSAVDARTCVLVTPIGHPSARGVHDDSSGAWYIRHLPRSARGGIGSTGECQGEAHPERAGDHPARLSPGWLSYGEGMRRTPPAGLPPTW